MEKTTINGVNVPTAVLRILQANPDKEMASKDVSSVLSKSGGITQALWTLVQRGMIELVSTPSEKPRRYRLTPKGSSYEGNVTYMATPKKLKAAE